MIWLWWSHILYVVLSTNPRLSSDKYNVHCNRAYYSSGGAIYYTTGQSISTNAIVIQCQFISNFARGSGGAIYKTGRNDIIVIGRNTYSNNTAYSFGGAV